MKQRGIFWSLGLLASGIHIGTAILRLSTFWPYPRTLDFMTFYAAGWLLRHGLSPYPWPAPLPAALAQAGLQGLPAPNSFPFWPWLLQPVSRLPYPLAAWLWLTLNLLLLLWCTMALATLAGLKSVGQKAFLFLLVLTFGPVTLNLTLGQTGILLLTLALLIGSALPRSRPDHQALIAGLWLPALATKLFPLTWLVGLTALRARRAVIIGASGAILLLAVHLAAMPEITHAYLMNELPARATLFSETGMIDDQSLPAWMLRMTQPMHFTVPGLVVSWHHPVDWIPLWPIERTYVKIVATLFILSIGAGLAFHLWRCPAAQAEVGFYLWVLFSLLILPHTERYNHTLLLPAMAWLWRQGEQGRRFALGGYFLAGLSRLNHLWALLLPAPWGPLASGFGLYAVVLLGVGLLIESLRAPQTGTSRIPQVS